MRLRSPLSLLFFLLSCVLLLPGCSSDKKKKDARAAERLESVDVAYPMIDSVTLHREYPAYFTAFNDANVVARVNGYVQKKLFANGQWVKAGQPLYVIEQTTYRDQLNQAQAQLQTALANNDYNTRNYHAMSKALESDAVSGLDVIQAKSAMEQSEAAIKTAKAAVSSAELMLGYCTVRAPFEGRVAASNVIVGDYVSGEGEPQVLTQVVDDRDLNVHFSVEDAQYLLMTDTPEGRAVDYTKVPITFNDTIIGTYYGSLSYDAPTVNKSTGTIDLWLHLKNPDGIFKSGMFATVHLPYANDPKAVIIKDAAIGTDQLGKYVYLVNDSNRVVYTHIEPGELYQDTLRIVTKGVRPTDRYVTQALLKVRDGMPVNPVLPGQKAGEKAGKDSAPTAASKDAAPKADTKK